jgi:hypothetical protein
MVDFAANVPQFMKVAKKLWDQKLNPIISFKNHR